MFLGFPELEPSSSLVVLTGIEELKALEGLSIETLGQLECLKELEKIISPPSLGY